MTDFGDLGLRDELLRVLDDEGIERPTGLQRAVIPVLRRGGNLVGRASAGSGKTLAHGLGVLDRLEPALEAEADAVRARVIVLRPTSEAAEATALSLFPYAQAVGLAISVPGGSWGTAVEAAELVVGTVESVLAAVRSSALKLDAVETVVVDGASAIAELGYLEALETVLDQLPRDAQRVLLTTTSTAALEDLVDRRVKRALRFPPEAAVPAGAPAASTGPVGYLVLPEAKKLDLLARALAGREPGGSPPLLFFRTDERAAQVAESLTTRGFVLGELGDDDADAVIAAAGTTRAELEQDAGAAPGQTISYDVPPDEEALLARHAGDADAIVLLSPGELPHLREIAGRARLRPQAASLAIDSPALRGVAAFRDRLRQALDQEDLGAQMMVLEPLFEEFSPAELAAAATALLRRRPPPQPAPAAAGPAPRATGAAATGAVPATERGAPPATWARLFVGLGSRDAVKPGDLVGAIAGEAEIPGTSVGRIDIRDNFSIVEVQADLADRVISALNGTTMKGRSVRVDFDRGADRSRGGGDRQRGGGRPGGGRPHDGPRRTLVRRPRPSE